MLGYIWRWYYTWMLTHEENGYCHRHTYEQGHIILCIISCIAYPITSVQRDSFQQRHVVWYDMVYFGPGSARGSPPRWPPCRTRFTVSTIDMIISMRWAWYPRDFVSCEHRTYNIDWQVNDLLRIQNHFDFQHFTLVWAEFPVDLENTILFYNQTCQRTHHFSTSDWTTHMYTHAMHAIWLASHLYLTHITCVKSYPKLEIMSLNIAAQYCTHDHCWGHHTHTSSINNATLMHALLPEIHIAPDVESNKQHQHLWYAFPI